jgi:hypothetical protein
MRARRRGHSHPCRAEAGPPLGYVSSVFGKQFYERVRRDDRREEVVDPLERRLGLFGLLGPGGVANHDRQIAVVARRPGIALDAPVEVDASEHDHLDALACQLKREIGADECRLQGLLEQVIVARLELGLQLLDDLVVPGDLFRRLVEALNPGLVLHLVENALRILAAENRIADPIEGDEVLGFASRVDDLDRCTAKMCA